MNCVENRCLEKGCINSIIEEKDTKTLKFFISYNDIESAAKEAMSILYDNETAILFLPKESKNLFVTPQDFFTLGEANDFKSLQIISPKDKEVLFENDIKVEDKTIVIDIPDSLVGTEYEIRLAGD